MAQTRTKRITQEQLRQYRELCDIRTMLGKLTQEEKLRLVAAITAGATIQPGEWQVKYEAREPGTVGINVLQDILTKIVPRKTVYRIMAAVLDRSWHYLQVNKKLTTNETAAYSAYSPEAFREHRRKHQVAKPAVRPRMSDFA